jgi:hypothetical protein
MLEARTASLLRCRLPRFAGHDPAFQNLRCQNHSGTAAGAVLNVKRTSMSLCNARDDRKAKA